MSREFHQKSYRLLGGKPEISKSSVYRLYSIEGRCGFIFPAALREWYSLDDASGILAARTSDYPFHLDELGEPIDFGDGGRDFVREGVLPIMTENQGVCNWAVALDGSNDPPVLVEVDSAPNVKWQPFAETFSQFIYALILDNRVAQSITLCAQDVPLSEGDLNLLRKQFKSEPITRSWPAEVSYRFSGPDQYVLIWAGERQADWHFQATSSARMNALLDVVWSCGDLRNSLYEIDEEGRKILLERRAKDG